MDAKFLNPKTLEEALILLNNEECIPLAGGTDLVVKNRKESPLHPLDFPHPLIFVGNIKELHSITVSDGLYHIGACITHNEIIDSPLIDEDFKKPFKDIASFPLRNQGSIGGNIANASPVGDSLPLLYVLDAQIVLVSLKKKRIVPISEFIIGPGKTIREKDELITEILVPPAPYSYWRKVSQKGTNSIGKVSLFATRSFKDKKLNCFKLAAGGLGAKVKRDISYENQLLGLTVEEFKEEKEMIISHYLSIFSAIDDPRASKEYKLQVITNLLNDFLKEE